MVRSGGACTLNFDALAPALRAAGRRPRTGRPPVIRSHATTTHGNTLRRTLSSLQEREFAWYFGGNTAFFMAMQMQFVLRALLAYDEALRVRTEYDMPLEYANTLSNKANALMNLPDDIEHPELGNPANLVSAARLLETARDVFEKHGVHDRARVVEDLRASLAAEVAPKGSA